MDFVKAFLSNLIVLFLIGLGLFLIFPTTMQQVFQLYGTLFGPIAIILVVIAALPRKKRGIF